MKRSTPLACLVLCGAMIAAPVARAQRPLTLDDAVKIGLEQNRDLKIALLKAESVGTARVDEVRAARLPSLKLFASYTRLSDIGVNAIPVPIPGVAPFAITTYYPDNYAARLSLTQPLFTGFRLQSMQRAAEQTRDAAQDDYSSTHRQTVFTITEEYWTLFKLEKTLDAIQSNLKESQSHLEDVRTLVAHGAALENDFLKTQVLVSNIQLQQIETAKNIQVASAALMNTLGLPLDTRIVITSQPSEDSTSLGALDELIVRARAHRSELAALDARVAAADANVSVARAGYYPQVALGANLYYQNPNQRYFPAQNTFKGTWDASVNLSWDVWNWNTAGDQAQQAESARDALVETKSSLEESVALEVTQNLLARQTSFDRIRVAREAVDQAKENLRVVNVQYAKGVATNSDVLDAESLAMQAQVNYIAAVVDANVAAAKLAESVGE